MIVSISSMKILLNILLRGGKVMELCIGIGFVILCFALLVFVIGFFGYVVHIGKNKELDIAPRKSSQVPTLEE